jgi:hypothetical protein
MPPCLHFFRLLSFHGPEGDEARIMLKELRTKHQEPAVLSMSLTTGSARANTPMFSPFSQQDSRLMSTGLLSVDDNGDYSSVRSSNNHNRRESLSTSAVFDRYLPQSSSQLANTHERDGFQQQQKSHGVNEEDDSDAERSGFQFSRDTSQMSIESPSRPL